MTIILLDGFEMYGVSNALNSVGLDSVYVPFNANTFGSNYFRVGDMTSGNFLPGQLGGRALYQPTANTANATMYYPLSSLTELTIGMHVRVSSNNTIIFYLGNTGAWASNRIGGFVNSAGIFCIYVWYNNSGSIYTIDTVPIKLNTWYYYELHVVSTGQTVTAQAYKNSKLIANINNINVFSSNALYQTFNQLQFGYNSNGSGSSSDIYWDNMYITTGELLGPIYISPMMPSADTSQKDWGSTSVNSNYTEISETDGANISTQVVSTTVGDKDYYDHTPISVNDGIYNVLGVQSQCVYSTDQYGPSQFKVTLDTGTAEVDLDTIDVLQGVEFGKQRQDGSLVTVNPNTSQQFQISELNSSTIGLERTT